LLGHEEWLWTFVDADGVESTNDEGERTERQGVLLRKASGGADSPRGSRFVERILTVVDTCRRQGKKVWDYLRAPNKTCFICGAAAYNTSRTRAPLRATYSGGPFDG
jgi:hypothetical protein